MFVRVGYVGLLTLQGERKWKVATERGWLEAGGQDEPLLYGSVYSSALWGNTVYQ